jgi:hypothetical protein
MTACGKRLATNIAERFASLSDRSYTLSRSICPSTAVTLHSNPGLLHIKPGGVPAEVCPGYKYKDDTILSLCINFGPGFEYKQLGGFRGLSGAKQPCRTYSGFEYRATPEIPASFLATLVF